VTAPLSDLCQATAADPPAARRGAARSSLLAMLRQADMQWHSQQRAWLLSLSPGHQAPGLGLASGLGAGSRVRVWVRVRVGLGLDDCTAVFMHQRDRFEA